MIAKRKAPIHFFGILLLILSGLNLAQSPQTTSSSQTKLSSPTLGAAAPNSSSTAPQHAIETANPDDYLISPEDMLAVYVYDVPELSRDYLVSSGGTITVPLLTKPVRAAGLSLNEFSHKLEESFRESGVLSNPRVSVDVRQSRRSVISVEGAVKNPQAVPVFGRTTLRSVLDQCGGLAEDAGSTITVTRGTARTGGVGDGDSEGGAIHVDAKRLRDTSDPVSRFEVWPGDRVSVEHAGLFYVLGEVSRPGGYNLKTAQERVTVLEALAIAGDFTSVAKRDKARIIRKDPKAPDGLLEVALNVKAIIAGHSPDPVLQTNDILYVPGSGPRKVARTFTQSAVAIASGAGSVALYGR